MYVLIGYGIVKIALQFYIYDAKIFISDIDKIYIKILLKEASMNSETVLCINTGVTVAIFIGNIVKYFLDKNDKKKQRQEDDRNLRLDRRYKYMPNFSLYHQPGYSGVELDIVNGKQSIITTILLKNITGEEATDIRLEAYDDLNNVYFKTDEGDGNSYNIFDSNPYHFCIPGTSIIFSFSKDVTGKEFSEIKGVVYFKLTFRDKLGNLYRQEFKVGYEYKERDFVFTDEWSSGRPELIEENLNI